MRKEPAPINDIYICREKVNAILKEYGCSLESSDGWHTVLLRDDDTDETTSLN